MARARCRDRRAPPARFASAARRRDPSAWMRANLFSSFWNSVATLLTLALLAWMVPKVLGWMILDAVWGAAGVAQCDAVRGQGACWTVVREKFRFMLFGVYPFEQQWRRRWRWPCCARCWSCRRCAGSGTAGWC
jgi:hypothetical protein